MANGSRATVFDFDREEGAVAIYVIFCDVLNNFFPDGNRSATQPRRGLRHFQLLRQDRSGKKDWGF